MVRVGIHALLDNLGSLANLVGSSAQHNLAQAAVVVAGLWSEGLAKRKTTNIRIAATYRSNVDARAAHALDLIAELAALANQTAARRKKNKRLHKWVRVKRACNNRPANKVIGHVDVKVDDVVVKRLGGGGAETLSVCLCVDKCLSKRDLRWRALDCDLRE